MFDLWVCCCYVFAGRDLGVDGVVSAADQRHYSQEQATGVMGPVIVVAGLGGTVCGGLLAQLVVEADVEGAVLCAGVERGAGGASGAAVLLWAAFADDCRGFRWRCF